jgi:hypothetical protein
MLQVSVCKDETEELSRPVTEGINEYWGKIIDLLLVGSRVDYEKNSSFPPRISQN